MRSIRLTVPYESQHDNASGTGWRECFSSSCAMVARFWGVVATDDDYNRARTPHGDTTEVQAQMATLRALGLRANFWSCGRRVDIERELAAGRPVAVGWLHRGLAHRPTGGHWSVIVGLQGRDHFLMHDPAGEPLLASGGHIRGSSGSYVLCSWANFLQRWEVEGPATGWYISAMPAATVRLRPGA